MKPALELTITLASYNQLPATARLILDTHHAKILGGGMAWRHQLPVTTWRRLEPYSHLFLTRALPKAYADRLNGKSGHCRYCRCTDERGCSEGCCWIDPRHTVCSECAAWILIGGSAELRQSMGNARVEQAERRAEV